MKSRSIFVKGRPRPLIVGVVFLAALTGQAFGDVIYTYTGKPYTAFLGSGPFTTLDNLALSFRVPAALAPSTDYFFTQPGSIVENPSLLGWESFDGVYSTSSSDLQGNPFLRGQVSTDASGNISSWDFNVGGASAGVTLAELSCNLVGCYNSLTGGAPFDFVQTLSQTTIIAAGSGTAGTWTSAATAPLPPFISSLSPSSVPAGETTSVTVNGSGFGTFLYANPDGGCVVYWNTTALPTQCVRSTQLIVAVPPTLTATAGTASITVVNPGNVTSNAATFILDERSTGIQRPRSNVSTQACLRRSRKMTQQCSVKATP